MSDVNRRKDERKAADGDLDAISRVRVGRCRDGNCCAHAKSALNTPTGCGICPFLGWDPGDESWICNIGHKVAIPTNDSYEVMDAVPGKCPLWGGAILVDLKQLESLR